MAINGARLGLVVWVVGVGFRAHQGLKPMAINRGPSRGRRTGGCSHSVGAEAHGLEAHG